MANAQRKGIFGFATCTLHNVEIISFFWRRSFRLYNLKENIARESYSLNANFKLLVKESHIINNSIPLSLEFFYSKPHTQLEILLCSTESPAKKRVLEVYRPDELRLKNGYNVKVNLLNDNTLFFEIYFLETIRVNVFHDLLTNNTFSDVTIVSSDGKDFKTHKCILASKSDVFKAHLLHNTVENSTGKIESTFDAEVIKELLSYIYTAEVNNLDNLSETLLAAADFYHVDGLKDLCELYLCKNLTMDNVLEMYKLADLYKTDNLRRFSMTLIYMQRDIMLQTEAWAKFKLDCNELVINLLEYVLQSF